VDDVNLISKGADVRRKYNMLKEEDSEMELSNRRVDRIHRKIGHYRKFLKP
jgi:ribosomal protein L44E